MTEQELIDLAVRMRAAQKQYFKSRTSTDLIAAKQLEKQFDDATVPAPSAKPKNVSGYSPISKTPASRQLLNITKAALNNAEAECEKLRAALEAIENETDPEITTVREELARLRAALEAQLEAHNYAEALQIARKALGNQQKKEPDFKFDDAGNEITADDY